VCDSTTALHYSEGDAAAIWLWLASFRQFAEGMTQQGHRLFADWWSSDQADQGILVVPEQQFSFIRRVIRAFPVCRKLVKSARLYLARRKAWRTYYPRDPQRSDSNSLIT
jgi:hypothetical protein